MNNGALWIVFVSLFSCSISYLYPLESESRQIKNLNGIWKFLDGNQGLEQKWYSGDLPKYMYMPVPGSFNEINSLHLDLRDYLGWVWYQKDFYLGRKWSGSKIFLYFGAADHHAVVWCNGIEVGTHSGGHVPFHIEITKSVVWEGRNLLTVAVNNTLTPNTIPQGYLVYPNDTSRYPNDTYTYSHKFDYFDYAGLNRNVFLYSVPQIFIKDIDIVADLIPEPTLRYKIHMSNNKTPDNCTVRIKGSGVVFIINGCNMIFINDNLAGWHPERGRLYDCEVTTWSGKLMDIYRTHIGFRTLNWNEGDLKLNGENLYLKGFGMHEDSDIRGRGFDPATSLRDMSILKWTGANAIRTSHYPYSEEFLMQCDGEGIAVILEVPACSLDNFTDTLYKEHEKITLEIISNYKHHPSIIMWSLANEPYSDMNTSTSYFNRLYNAAKSADPTRPVTFVTSRSPTTDKAIGNMDVILLNRYSGWYQDGGRLDLIEYQIKEEISTWYKLYKKPVIITEYGAGSIPGMHGVKGTMWTEDYQSSLLKTHFEVFDDLRREKILNGEMIWNLIDFKTPQEYFRPGYCMKGIFTRQREPKSAAYVVRKRYNKLRTFGPLL